MGDLIQLFSDEATNSGDAEATVYAPARVVTESSVDTVQPLSFDDIYRSKDSLPGEVATARPLLMKLAELLDKASTETDEMAADDYVTQAHLTLPELFCFRSMGDGFGMVIIGLFHAIQNQRGMPLNGIQVLGMKATTKRLLNEPFISEDQAVDELERLEGVGLNYESPRLGIIAEVLGG